MGQRVSSYLESRTYLHAAEQGELHQVAASLHSHPGLSLLKASTHNADHHTAWHLAAQHGHLPILTTIVDQIRCWSESPDFGSWMISCNIGEDVREVIASLVDTRNAKGQTPLMLAAGCGHAEAVAYLLNQGADPWTQDRLGCRCGLLIAFKIAATGFRA